MPGVWSESSSTLCVGVTMAMTRQPFVQNRLSVCCSHAGSGCFIAFYAFVPILFWIHIDGVRLNDSSDLKL